MAKLLIVEDDELNREMLARRFVRKGYETVFATDGLQSLNVAETEQPDLILMDVTLPVMGGYDATRSLKTNPATQAIPVIALSAHAMVSEREDAISAGCDEYETKPVDFNRLLEKIERLVSRRPLSAPQESEPNAQANEGRGR